MRAADEKHVSNKWWPNLGHAIKLLLFNSPCQFLYIAMHAVIRKSRAIMLVIHAHHAISYKRGGLLRENILASNSYKTVIIQFVVN